MVFVLGVRLQFQILVIRIDPYPIGVDLHYVHITENLETRPLVIGPYLDQSVLGIENAV